ncbi:MAG: GGDEF domain-containing protein [Rhodocyclaceae bacterium]|nr:GGDEF domain-containing protein [Rhodocyclaceae bacterium]
MSTQNKKTLVRWVCEIARAKDDSLAPYRDHIMMSMGAVTFVVLVPFALNNLVQGRYGVFSILVFVLVATAIDTHALWRGRQAPIPYALLLIPFVLGVTVAVIVQGVPGVLWVYPIVVYCYFVLRRRTAVAWSLAILLYTTGLTLFFVDGALAIRIFATVLVTIVMINIVLNVISDLHRTLANQALTDPLTGVFNRRFMEEILERLVARAERQPLMATILMIDIDYFKQVNDCYGHERGDAVLKRVVDVVAARLRRGDRLFRWGGEEFLVLLEGTGLESALAVAESVRESVAAAAIMPERQVTVSIGVSQYVAGQDIDGWTRAADVALYQAKAEGRNRVACARAGSARQ